jgi:hypothetical protein
MSGSTLARTHTANDMFRIGPLNAFWRVWRFREIRWGGKLVGTDQYGNKYYEQLEAIPSIASSSLASFFAVVAVSGDFMLLRFAVLKRCWFWIMT